MSKKHINWHEATVCAIQITLRDYAHLLEYYPEYPLGKNAYRIDLLVVHKLSKMEIPHSIAKIFRSYNLFEIKGVHSSLTVNAYYKTIGYASLLIAAGNSAPYDRRDISLSFLCRRYPRKLMKHLAEDCKITVAKQSSGVYYINKDIYPIQIIVSKELPADESLYLRCLTDRLTEKNLIAQLADDSSKYTEHPAYIKYMEQLIHANVKTKGESLMYCEALFELYGTSSQEIAQKAHEEDAKEIERLKALLRQHNIPYEQEKS